MFAPLSQLSWSRCTRYSPVKWHDNWVASPRNARTIIGWISMRMSRVNKIIVYFAWTTNVLFPPVNHRNNASSSAYSPITSDSWLLWFPPSPPPHAHPAPLSLSLSLCASLYTACLFFGLRSPGRINTRHIRRSRSLLPWTINLTVDRLDLSVPFHIVWHW
jgi:hypothetical protein